MRIIKEGIDFKTQEFKARCSICEAEYVFDYAESELNLLDQGPYLVTACPCCSHNVYTSVKSGKPRNSREDYL